ncbi:MAG: alanine racemase [Candidatus Sumerlaeia bacterium]
MSTATAVFLHRPTRAIIHLARFRSNIERIRSAVGPNRGVMAVIKADAYGHGMMPLARAAREAGAVWLGVATVDEALMLKGAGLGLPILILAPIMPADAPAVVEAGLRAAVGNLAQVDALSHAAQKCLKPAMAHLKIDTGMGRSGFWHEDLPGVLPRLAAARSIRWEGVMTHFAESDSPDPSFTEEQIARFEHALVLCRQAGLNFRIVHAANSGAVLQHPNAWYNLVRPGVMLYGMLPDPLTRRTIDIDPVMSFVTAVADVRDVGKGRSLSYGRTFTTERRSRIALLPVGYGDGYSRLFSSAAQVVVRGLRAPVVGRVCMDQTLVDVTDVPGVEIGDRVLLWGRETMDVGGGRSETVTLPAEEAAQWRRTITYELTCNISPRVPREYVE